MFVPRIARFHDIIWHDATRSTEFWSGLECILVGFWILVLWPISNVPNISEGLSEYPSATIRGILITLLGIVQVMAAGTKWVDYRKWTATLALGAIGYIFIVYLKEAPYTLPTAFTLHLVIKELWVSWRIWHDKAVNGADRRRFHRDETGHAIVP